MLPHLFWPNNILKPVGKSTETVESGLLFGNRFFSYINVKKKKMKLPKSFLEK
jgi:hypothetical protein